MQHSIKQIYVNNKKKVTSVLPVDSTLKYFKIENLM